MELKFSGEEGVDGSLTFLLAEITLSMDESSNNIVLLTKNDNEIKILFKEKGKNS